MASIGGWATSSRSERVPATTKVSRRIHSEACETVSMNSGWA